MAFNFFNRKKSDDETVKKLPTDAIVPNRFQPRKVFQEEALNELALTIKQHGLLQPIVVREYDPGRYEIIAGGDHTIGLDGDSCHCDYDG